MYTANKAKLQRPDKQTVCWGTGVHMQTATQVHTVHVDSISLQQQPSITSSSNHWQSACRIHSTGQTALSAAPKPRLRWWHTKQTRLFLHVSTRHVAIQPSCRHHTFGEARPITTSSPSCKSTSAGSSQVHVSITALTTVLAPGPAFHQHKRCSRAVTLAENPVHTSTKSKPNYCPYDMCPDDHALLEAAGPAYSRDTFQVV